MTLPLPTLVAAILAPRSAARAWLAEKNPVPRTARAVVEWLVLLGVAAALSAWLVEFAIDTALRWAALYAAPVAAWAGLRALGFPPMLGTPKASATPILLPDGMVESKRVAATPVAHARVRITLAASLAPWLAFLLICAIRSAFPGAVNWAMLLPLVPVAIGGGWIVAVIAHGAFAARAFGTGRRMVARFWRAIIVESIVLGALVALTWWLFTTQLAEVRVVPSQSMLPTLFGGAEMSASDPEAKPGFDVFGGDAHGDRILIDRKAYVFGPPSRWDVVVFEHPGYDALLVKRIVGLPGDKLAIADGRIRVDGQVVVRPDAVVESQLLPCWQWSAERARMGAPSPAVLPTQTEPAREPSRAPAQVEPQFVTGLSATEVGGPVSFLNLDDGRRVLKVEFGTLPPLATAPPSDARRQLGGGGDVSRIGCVADFTDRTPVPPGFSPSGIADRHDLICEAVFAVAEDVSEVRLSIDGPDGMYHVTLRGPAASPAKANTARIDALWPEDAGATVTDAGAGYTLPAAALVRVRWQNVDERLRVFVNRQEIGALATARPTPGDCSREYRPDSTVPDWAEQRTTTWIGADGALLLLSWNVFAPTIYIAHGTLEAGNTLVVPDGRFVMLGDAHNVLSEDSRTWIAYRTRDEQGRVEILPERRMMELNRDSDEPLRAPFIPLGAIRGRVVGVVSPADAIRPIH